MRTPLIVRVLGHFAVQTFKTDHGVGRTLRARAEGYEKSLGSFVSVSPELDSMELEDRSFLGEWRTSPKKGNLYLALYAPADATTPGIQVDLVNFESERGTGKIAEATFVGPVTEVRFGHVIAQSEGFLRVERLRTYAAMLLLEEGAIVLTESRWALRYAKGNFSPFVPTEEELSSTTPEETTTSGEDGNRVPETGGSDAAGAADRNGASVAGSDGESGPAADEATPGDIIGDNDGG